MADTDKGNVTSNLSANPSNAVNVSNKKTVSKLKTTAVNDGISKGKTMTGSPADDIKVNPIQEEELAEINQQQRMKRRMIMRRYEGKIGMARKRALLRRAGSKVITNRARKLAIQKIKTKLSGGRDPSTLSPMEKQRLEDIMSKRKVAVRRLAMRLIPQVRKKEAARFMHREQLDLSDLNESHEMMLALFDIAIEINEEEIKSDDKSTTIDAINNRFNSQFFDAKNKKKKLKDDKEKDQSLEPKNEAVEQIDEAIKLNSKVRIHDPGKRHHGEEGTVVEFRRGLPGVRPSYYTVDHGGTSTQFTRENIKTIKEEVDSMFEEKFGKNREAIPRSGQKRKNIDLVPRDDADRKVSDKPYRLQSIMKKIVDEAKKSPWERMLAKNPKHAESEARAQEAKAALKKAGEDYQEVIDGEAAKKLNKEEFNIVEEANQVTVGNYTTKHFDICPTAIKLYSKIKDMTPMVHLIVENMMLHDMFFKLEKQAVAQGTIDQDDLEKAKHYASMIMDNAKQMDLVKEHSYINDVHLQTFKKLALAGKKIAEEKKGLWANIHAKRKRIKAGSGERMRKPGSEGAPSAENLRVAAESTNQESTLNELSQTVLKSFTKNVLRKHPDTINTSKLVGKDVRKRRALDLALDKLNPTSAIRKPKIIATTKEDLEEDEVLATSNLGDVKIVVSKNTIEEQQIQIDDNHGCSLDDEWIEELGLTEHKFIPTGFELYEDWNELEEEAEHMGRKVRLNKPFLTPGGPKKRSVYVKHDQTGNVVKVNFGDPNLTIKRDDPTRKRSYRARHHCHAPGPRHKANYWSCKYWSATPTTKLDKG